MNMIFSIPSFLIGVCSAAVIVFLFFQRRLNALYTEKIILETKMQSEKAALEDHLRASFQKLQKESQEQFLALATEKFKNTQLSADHDLEKRQKAINDMVTPIGQRLGEMATRLENLDKTGTTLEGQLKIFAQTQQMLQQETQNLVRLLRNPVDRGKWGEMQLQRIFETVGLIEGQHYTQQHSFSDSDHNQKRPDFVVHLPAGLQIIIDVKAPIEPYWDSLDTDNDAAQQRAVVDFSKKVRDHLKSLSTKTYWNQFQSPEFVVMFLPTEGLYSLAVSHDRNLIEDAAKHNVILASPTTVMGLLRVARYGWQQQSIAEEARNISELGSELYQRLSVFGEHVQKIGKNLGQAVGSYNRAIGSLESKVLPAARRFKDLHVQTGGKQIEILTPIEETERVLNAPEFYEDSNSNNF
jgi:DNA recombination protein RmuC